MCITLILFSYICSDVAGLYACKYDNWTLHNGICYRPLYNHIPGTYFTKGNGKCAEVASGASLLMPKTKTQFEFVMNSYFYFVPFWIGLQLAYDKNWTWIDGTAFDIPVNITEGVIRFGYPRCAVMSNQSRTTLQEISCQEETGVICQMDALLLKSDTTFYSSCRCMYIDSCHTSSASDNTTMASSFNIEDLKIVKSSLSSYIRTKISASDSRGSSRFIGSTGILLICFIIGFIVAMDLSPPNGRIIRSVRRLRKKLAYRVKL